MARAVIGQKCESRPDLIGFVQGLVRQIKKKIGQKRFGVFPIQSSHRGDSYRTERLQLLRDVSDGVTSAISPNSEDKTGCLSKFLHRGSR